jgi:hypothetical protein
MTESVYATMDQVDKEHLGDAEKLLTEPNLWSMVDQELAVTIREDPEGRQATFAVMLSAFNHKPANLMLLGSSAIGKTWMARNTSAFLPPENVIVLGSSTQRAWFYCGEPVYKPHPFIPNRKLIDHYAVDWRQKVVVILDNVKPETLKDLKPTMSKDQPEIDIQTTEKTQGGRNQTRKVRTIGSPAFINCSTWPTWEAELTSRHFYLSPRDNPVKYEAAADYLTEEYTTGKAPASELIPLIQNAIRYLISLNLTVVIHPNVIAKLKEKFQWKSGRDIRDYERAATIVQSIGWFHALQRERTEQGHVVADERDLAIMDGFIEPLLKTSKYGTSGEVLDYYERILKPLSEKGDVPYAEIRSKHLEIYERPLSREQLQIMNRSLESLGLIELVVDQLDKRRRLVRVLWTDEPKRTASTGIDIAETQTQLPKTGYIDPEDAARLREEQAQEILDPELQGVLPPGVEEIETSTRKRTPRKEAKGPGVYWLKNS